MCVGENLRGKKSVEVKKADLRKIRGQRPAGRSFGSESPRDGPVERRGGREAGRQAGRAPSRPRSLLTRFSGKRTRPRVGSVALRWYPPLSVLTRRLQGGFVTRARQRAGFVFLNEEASVSRTRGLGGGRRFFFIALPTTRGFSLI